MWIYGSTPGVRYDNGGAEELWQTIWQSLKYLDLVLRQKERKVCLLLCHTVVYYSHKLLLLQVLWGIRQECQRENNHFPIFPPCGHVCVCVGGWLIKERSSVCPSVCSFTEYIDGGCGNTSISSVQISSVTQLRPTLCNPKDWSMPGLPVHHQLP